MIQTTNRPEERKVKIAKLREHQQPLFEALGMPEALYIPKMSYRPRSGAEHHIGLFESELRKNEDIYTEFIDKDYNSEDPARILYKLKHNPHWEEEFEKVKDEKKGYTRYLVPIAELIKIDRGSVVPNPDNFEILDPNLDAPISQMTIRDLAAILTRKPISLKEWLNNLVK